MHVLMGANTPDDLLGGVARSLHSLGDELQRQGHQVIYALANVLEVLATYDPWHSPGTTLATARNCAKRLLAGKLPWPDGPVVSKGDGDTDRQVPPAGPGAAKWKTRLLDSIGYPAALLAARATGDL